MTPPARASALTARSSASTRAVWTRSLASPAESRQAPRSQAAVDTAPVTPAAPRRSKTTSRRANSDSSRETATRSPTRSGARAESGRPATSTASSRSSIGPRQPTSTAPPALPSAPLPAHEHMFDSVVHPSDQNGDFPHEPAGLVPMTAPALGPASSLASAAVDMAPATGVLGCPSCDCIRLRALLTPASSGALVARVRAGRDGQSAGRSGGYPREDWQRALCLRRTSWRKWSPSALSTAYRGLCLLYTSDAADEE